MIYIFYCCTGCRMSLVINLASLELQGRMRSDSVMSCARIILSFDFQLIKTQATEVAVLR